MSDEISKQKSFSPWKRWGFGLSLMVRTALVLAVVVMVNYLGARWCNLRFYLNSATRMELSPRTLGLLKSITNDVRVTLFYDHNHPLYTSVSALLNEYRDANSRFHVTTVDYLRDAGAAEKIKVEYKNYLAGVTNKNLIIFDCQGRVKVVNGNALAEYVLEQVPNETEREFRRKPVAFLGEKMFSSALLSVTSPKPLKAYYLINHGEHRLDGTDEAGYKMFNSVLEQNYIKVETLSLLGSNTVPGDCNLLVLAGPVIEISTNELEKIQQYLTQGGRLLALLSSSARGRQTGLERLLVRWNVLVDEGAVIDPDQTESQTGGDVVVSAYSPHPLVNPMIGYGLYLIRPRPIAPMESRSSDAGALKVLSVAFTGENSVLASDPRGKKRRYAVAAVVENAVPGVVTEHGTTRILVVGDSAFLDNQCIEKWANRDFAGYAVNWLLERTQLMQGLGPRPIKDFRLTMTKSQTHTVQWILLAGMPGAVLLLGGLVWLRRRS